MHTHGRDLTVAAITALATAPLGVAMMVLYFLYSGPPPASNVLSRNLVTLVTLVGYLIFAVGVARILRAARGGDTGYAGQTAVGALIAYVAVTLVATSLEVGTALQYPDGSLDPTTDGPLAAGMAFAHGPAAHLLLAVFFVGFAGSVAGLPADRRPIPAWMVKGSIAVAAMNVLSIPSLYFGMDAADFYAANGWGAVACVGGINMLWFVVLGAGLLRTGRAFASA